METEVSLAKQAIVLEGVSNARELGGYRIDGKTIAGGLLLRSANLSAAADSAVQALHEKYRLAVIFDFRSSAEHDAAPNREVPGARQIWLPCLNKIVSGSAGNMGMSKNMGEGKMQMERIADALLANVDNPKMVQLAKNLYPMIVFDEEVQSHYAEMLDTLAALPADRAALWHCTQGKDRAGWASAFVLAALGADRDLIVKDFALSNVSYTPLIESVIAKGDLSSSLSAEQKETIYALVGVSVKNFESTLDEIDKRYGSLQNYLKKALNCNESKMQILRDKYLKR